MVVQKFICDEVHKIRSYVPVPFVVCSAHNLNLLINDAAEATIPGIKLFSTLLTFFFLLWFQLKPMGRTCSN